MTIKEIKISDNESLEFEKNIALNENYIKIRHFLLDRQIDIVFLTKEQTEELSDYLLKITTGE
jgi:hypothetical protein